MQLLQTDLEYILRRTPNDVRDIMKKYNLFMAGGFIRDHITREEPTDIDLFGAREDVLLKAADELSQQRVGIIHKSDNAITVLSNRPDVVQFITRWTYQEVEPLVKSFDFTVCQAVICNKFPTESPVPPEEYIAPYSPSRWDNWTSLCSDRFYPDLASRRLYYTSPQREEEAGGSMMRVRKFLGRGYHIEAESLAGVISRIVGKVHESRLAEGGLEQVVTGILREVDPIVIRNGSVTEELDD